MNYHQLQSRVNRLKIGFIKALRHFMELRSLYAQSVLIEFMQIKVDRRQTCIACKSSSVITISNV